MLKEYLMESWAMVLITVAFVILLKTTIFLDKRTIRRMLALVVFTFLLSIVVFIEFHLGGADRLRMLRTVLTAVRYSATPFVMAMILFALVRRTRWMVFVPAILFAAVNFLSIFTGIVFRVGEGNALLRGPLGYLPYVAVGLYSVFLIYMLFRHSNRQAIETIPILFLAFAFLSGLILPFILGRDYAKIFCSTIMVALFVYYVFSILQLTSKDSLTGLLNRQAYYAAVEENPKNITGIVSIDMNGLKAINDSAGHAAGDEALSTLAHCFQHAVNARQAVYRVGGDEFVVVCRRSSEEEINELIARIRAQLDETRYSCAIGYCCAPGGSVTVEEMLRESDRMMYADKETYYLNSGRRQAT